MTNRMFGSDFLAALTKWDAHHFRTIETFRVLLQKPLQSPEDVLQLAVASKHLAYSTGVIHSVLKELRDRDHVKYAGIETTYEWVTAESGGEVLIHDARAKMLAFAHTHLCDALGTSFSPTNLNHLEWAKSKLGRMEHFTKRQFGEMFLVVLRIQGQPDTPRAWMTVAELLQAEILHYTMGVSEAEMWFYAQYFNSQ